MSPVSLDNKDLFCTVSIGISSFKGAEDCKELIDIADTALYKAKNKGRNRVEKWAPELVQAFAIKHNVLQHL